MRALPRFGHEWLRRQLLASLAAPLAVGLSVRPISAQASSNAPAGRSQILADSARRIRASADSLYKLGTHDAVTRSIDLYAQAARLLDALGDRHGLALTYYDVGHSHDDLGHADSALVYYRKSLATFSTVKTNDVARPLHNLGNFFSQRGVTDSALFYLTLALVPEMAAGDSSLLSFTLSGIASTYARINRSDSALAYLVRARHVANAIHDAGAQTDVASVFGAYHYWAGRRDSALAEWRESLRLATETGNLREQGTASGNIGNVHQELGHRDSAITYLSRAVAIHRQMGNLLGESVTLNNIGRVHRALGRYDSTMFYYKKSLTLKRANGDLGGEFVQLSNMAFLQYRVMRPPDLIGAGASYDSAAAVVASQGGRAGSDANQISFRDFVPRLYEDWALSLLARRVEMGDEASSLASLAAIDRGRAQALLGMMRRSGGTAPALTVAGNNLPVEGAQFASRLRSQRDAALVYLVTQDTLLTWFIPVSGPVEVTRLAIRRDTLEAMVRAFRLTLGVETTSSRAISDLDGATTVRGSAPDPGATMFDSLARALGRVLLPREFESRLANVRDLVVSPHGSLGLIPFGVLYSPRSRQLLGTRFAIRYTPSLAMLGASEGGVRRSSASRALVVGNPTMPVVAHDANRGALTLPPLPGAERESRSVANLLGSTALTGAHATESAVRRAMPSARVIHLATHGFAYSSDARSRDSFVALAADSSSNGLLTAGKILDDPTLQLSADLVVLSACQTGLGNLRQSEGTVGLQRAFLAKGAQSVLVSLWSVGDRATELLMRRFYAHWLADGETKASALRRAQAEVRATKGFEHPRFWAAFQLVGGA